MPLMMWCKTPGASRQSDLGIVPQLSCQTTLCQLKMFKGYIFFDDIVNSWNLKLRDVVINNRDIWSIVQLMQPLFTNCKEQLS
jgi:hypothetical protein